MVVNQQSNKTRSNARGPTTAHPAYSHWNVEIASLSLRCGTLTSQYKDKLKIQLQDKALTAFIKEKESWTQQTFETVNWNACGTDFKRLSKNRQVNVSKACINYWHTDARHTTFYQEEIPCCFVTTRRKIGNIS
jgi:hypothetical protein